MLELDLDNFLVPATNPNAPGAPPQGTYAMFLSLNISIVNGLGVL
jgi:hypothetical protein